MVVRRFISGPDRNPMHPLRTTKSLLLATKGFGTFGIISGSAWRRNRLLILCYHGISVEDEHSAHPGYFLPATTFTRRIEILRQLDCNVLDLGEALFRLRRGSLPPRSVVLTFDDGWANFYTEALPVLRNYGFPATIYLTTYYCLFNRPVFRPALTYMLWKVRGQKLENSTVSWIPKHLDLRSAESRAQLVKYIETYAKEEALSGGQQDELAAQVADLVGFDYPALATKRLMNLMNQEEIAQIARCGISIQLHTHRHRTPLDRTTFIAEISENRRQISNLVNKLDSNHFSYPNGVVHPEFVAWLRDCGVQSATTCQPAFSSSKTDMLLLPRLLDLEAISEDEFKSWMTGFAAFMPRRKLSFLKPADIPE